MTAAFLFNGEESLGFTEKRRQITSGKGFMPLRLVLKKIRLPLFIGEKVKRCGKSAPRIWQQIWHGKPRRKQNQIGAARCLGNRCFSASQLG